MRIFCIFVALKPKIMKLKFSIQYGTQWGESLHVVVVYRSTDGVERSSNLLMLTDDGQQWTVETAAVTSRQHPVTELSYHYQVEDAEGRVLRREWSLVPRCYAFDVSQNYIFDDQWRDRPLNVHLYSNACLTTLHRPTGETISVLKVPLYRKTVLFRVSAPQLHPGQSLALVGSHPALGNWSEARYLRMEYMGQSDWMLSVNVDAILMPLEYKYVVVDDDTHSLVAWEEGDNRVVDTALTDGQVLVCHGGGLRLRETIWRAAGVVVPVFSLRSEHSFGVGDFGDLRRFVDWAVATGMRVIQLLPVNDTTTDGHWHDSYPYNITSCFALHPHYLDLEQLGELRDKKRLTAYRRRQRELNALQQSDYEAVDRVKNDYIKELFARDFLLRSLSVEGEVSNLKYHSSGHIYFTLKDEEAQLAAVMFAGSRKGLSFRLENGQKIVATGMTLAASDPALRETLHRAALRRAEDFGLEGSMEPWFRLIDGL